ncbi:hypothetical protein ACFC0L_04305 [Streptomyces brevispora]|uniref:hypothetical protein n=1 Tax=Streptomyces brevispora TaxID=887462 RepID=UPI0035D5FAF2
MFHFDGPGDQFLAESAFPYARWRYGCADSLLGSGMGGTVVGALARSLFDDGLLWQWIAESPADRRPALLGSMLEERDRICGFLAEHEVSCPNLARWFVPLDGVTDLTGSTLAALSAPSLPAATELLDLFLASSPERSASSALIGGGVEDLLKAARGMLAMSGLRGAVMVLGHAGHGNLLGLQSTMATGGAPGHDLRADHEALFMHVAAVGATVTLLGVCAAVPECWAGGRAGRLPRDGYAADRKRGRGRDLPVFAPSSKRPTASSRIRSLAALLASVKPPPCAHLTPHSSRPGSAAVRRTARHHPFKFSSDRLSACAGRLDRVAVPELER